MLVRKIVVWHRLLNKVASVMSINFTVPIRLKLLIQFETGLFNYNQLLRHPSLSLV